MYKDRSHAGQLLAEEFKEKILALHNIIVVALPRGGIPLAYEIAQKFHLPLDVFCVKKIGAPHNPELALGAVTEEGEIYLNQEIIKQYSVNEKDLSDLVISAQNKAKAQAEILREGRDPLNLDGKDVILVDDGIATGATATAAIELIKKKKVNSVILMTPVSSQDAWIKIRKIVDDFYVLDTPFYFWSVGRHYEKFPQVTNEEAINLLKKIHLSENPNEYFSTHRPI